MSELLLTSFVAKDSQAKAAELTAAQGALKQMVLDSVTSPHTRRNYSKALDTLFLFTASRPLTRALLQEWKASMDGLAPSTANVRLSAVRRLVGEARKNGLIGAEEAANLSDIQRARTHVLRNRQLNGQQLSQRFYEFVNCALSQLGIGGMGHLARGLEDRAERTL